MYVVAIFFLMFIALVFRLSMDRERVYVTYDLVDDTLVESLLSASIINRDELAMGGHSVIYRSITPEEIPMPDPSLIPVTFNPLDNPEIYSPYGDEFLEGAYDRFMKVLKKNLKLDNAMNASISGIKGVVTVDDFSVYNVFRAFDEDGNETGFRVVKYTRNASGGWSCYPYAENMTVDVYNSVDHARSMVCETSVSGTLSFDVVLSDYNAGSSFFRGMSEDDTNRRVTYSRIVDVKKK